MPDPRCSGLYRLRSSRKPEPDLLQQNLFSSMRPDPYGNSMPSAPSYAASSRMSWLERHSVLLLRALLKGTASAVPLRAHSSGAPLGAEVNLHDPEGQRPNDIPA